MDKLLTIWIPTYQRPKQLNRLLCNLEASRLSSFADVVVSDNDSSSINRPLPSTRIQAGTEVAFSYRRNPANLTAGINFLRGFEIAKTPWLMIVGDDDLFEETLVDSLYNLLMSADKSIAGFKFDSSLFGSQPFCVAGSLASYVRQLSPRDYPDAFNNLCLISNWVFRTEPYLRHISSAFLGYSSKISHLFPILRSCLLEESRIQFSPLKPVIHGTTEESSWPKAATWVEMVITMSSFCGFVDPVNRHAILKLLLHSDWLRYLAKCLRVQQFYGRGDQGISAWRVHIQLSLISASYGLAFLSLLPLLAVPQHLLPGSVRKRIGDPGNVDRW